MKKYSGKLIEPTFRNIYYATVSKIDGFKFKEYDESKFIRCCKVTLMERFKYLEDFVYTDLNIKEIAEKYGVTSQNVRDVISPYGLNPAIVVLTHTIDFSDDITEETFVYDLIIKEKITRGDFQFFLHKVCRVRRGDFDLKVKDLLWYYDKGLIYAEGINPVNSANALLGVVSLFRDNVEYLSQTKKVVNFNKVVDYIMNNKEEIQTITEDELKEVLFNL